MWSLIAGAAIGAVFGGLLTILITIWVEYLRSPSLILSLPDEPPRDFLQHREGTPAKILRPLRIRLTNKPLRGPRWLTRSAAVQCKATITFHHLDGQDVFGRAMEGRWTTSPEPTVIEGQGQVLHAGRSPDPVKLIIIDQMRLTLKSRVDVYPGESEDLDIVAQLDDDEQCYGWNNETYLGEHPWRNPNWRLENGRYLVRVRVVSSGQKCSAVFRLVNDVPILLQKSAMRRALRLARIS